MNAPRRLVIGIHDHQPVGNFDHVFAWAYDNAYAPFLDVFEGYEAVKIGMHHTGPLLEWMAANRPDYLKRVAALVEAGRVELIGGGFFEPILVVLSEEDRLEQLEWMGQFLEKHFGRRARGAWLAERIWEPHLAGTLSRAGVRYVALDDYHFARAGMDPSRLHGTYLTEDGGDPVAIFPISQELRYRIPFADPDEVRRVCVEAPVPEGAALSFFDDGEKFGVWPHTHGPVYDDGWLERFFTMLSDPDSGVTTALPSEVLAEPPSGRVYLPAASYFEMSEWTLPPELAERFAHLVHEAEESGRIEQLRPFLAGGFWRGFLAKYAESNLQQKLTQRTSVRVRTAAEPHRTRAIDQMMRAQCNCAYWHGVFGGIYLPHLRSAIQSARILAEAELWRSREAAGDAPALEVEELDLEVDGGAVVVVDTPAHTAGVKPAEGGALLLWDLHEPAHALHDVLTRRREGYHAEWVSAEDAPPQQEGNIHKIVRALPPGEKLTYDWYRRLSLIDHFHAGLPTAAALNDLDAHELGDFVALPYEHTVSRTEDEVSVTMTRDGHLWWRGGDAQPLRLEKIVRVHAGEPHVSCSHRITNTGSSPVAAWWGVECNVKLQSDEGDQRRLNVLGGEEYPLEARLDPLAAPGLELVDDGLGIAVRLEADGAPHWSSFGVHTLSQSEAGVDTIYQGSCVVVLRRVELGPGAVLEANLDLRVRT